MDVVRQTKGTVRVLALSGRLDAVAASSFQEDALAEVDGGASTMLLDLSGLDYMSSAGLRAILVIARRLQDENGRFAVCGLHGGVAEVFKVTGFESIVPVHADRASAIAALS